MGEVVGVNLVVVICGGVMELFVFVFSGILGSFGCKDVIGIIGGNKM